MRPGYITREVGVEVSETVHITTTAELEIPISEIEEELGGLIVDPGDAKNPPPGLIDEMIGAARFYNRAKFDELADELYRSATV